MVLKRNKPFENIVAIVLMGMIWVSYFIYTDTIKPDYHFTDDHELLRFYDSIQSKGFFNTLTEVINNDLKIRFRPFYYFHRILLVKILGHNFTLFYVYNFILSWLTSFFLYKFCRNNHIPTLMCLLFPFLILVGPQIEIWYRLGPAETIGVFLLSFSLFLLSLFHKTNNKIHLFISILTLTLSSLCKESFIAFMPAYVLFSIHISLQNEPFNFKAIIEKVKANLSIITIIAILFIIEALIILLGIGTNKIGYAGLDDQFDLIILFKTVYLYLRSDPLSKIVVFALLLYLIVNKFRLKKKDLFFFSFISILFFSIIIPQLFLYDKSGLYGRYLIPYSIGYSFLIVSIGAQIKFEQFFSKLALTILAILTVAHIAQEVRIQIIPKTNAYSKQRKDIQELLSTVITESKPTDTLFISLNSFENYEWGSSINTYFKHFNRPNIYFNIEKIAEAKDPFEKMLDKKFRIHFKTQIRNSQHAELDQIIILPYQKNNSYIQELTRDKTYKKFRFNDFFYFKK